jgi:di/tricarboxylate transporter
VEKNRAFVEQNIPFGDASRVLSLFSCLQCMGASRVLPVDHLERVLNDKKVAADVAGALVPVLLCILVCALGDFIDGDNPLVGRTLGLTVLIAGWWLAAPWPEVATSWAPVWLFPLAGIISAGDAAGKYMNNVTMLLIGAFLVDLCVEESGAGTRLGLVVIKRFGKQPLALILGFMTVAGVLSMFIGNTAVCMMMSKSVLAMNDLKVVPTSHFFLRYLFIFLHISRCDCSVPFILSIIERIDEENKDDNAASAERFAKAR